MVWGRSWRRGLEGDRKRDSLWIRSPLEEMKYLFKFKFSFIRFGIEAKRRVEIRGIQPEAE